MPHFFFFFQPSTTFQLPLSQQDPRLSLSVALFACEKFQEELVKKIVALDVPFGCRFLDG